MKVYEKPEVKIETINIGAVICFDLISTDYNTGIGNDNSGVNWGKN